MEIKRVWAVYWSATGMTKKVVTTVAEQAASALHVPCETLDFTPPAVREQTHSFTSDDLVIFGTPTYAGKTPNKLLPYLQIGFAGNGAMAAAVVTFGNRSYDNSLAELCAALEGCGFHTVSGAAFVGQHAFSDTLALGRPDFEDLALAKEFATKTVEKVSGLTEAPAPVAVSGQADAPYYVPKGTDGEPAKFLKAKPQTDMSKCCNCGLCARICPVGAINPENVADVPGVCIKCHACVKRCTRHAKYFDDPAFLSHKAMLEETFQRRAEVAMFL